MSIEDNEYQEYDNSDERSLHESIQQIDKKLETIKNFTKAQRVYSKMGKENYIW
jgi:tetrahydromethanopterin S-methyltransferase subunit G